MTPLSARKAKAVDPFFFFFFQLVFPFRNHSRPEFLGLDWSMVREEPQPLIVILCDVTMSHPLKGKSYCFQPFAFFFFEWNSLMSPLSTTLYETFRSRVSYFSRLGPALKRYSNFYFPQIAAFCLLRRENWYSRELLSQCLPFIFPF